MTDPSQAAWLALLGVVISTGVSSFVAMWVAKSSSTRQSKELDLELKKFQVSLARELSERKVDIAHRYAELRQQDEAAARDFLKEIAKENAIGFLYLDDVETKEKIWIRDNANLLIGRRPGCDIVLNNQFISREHCVLTATNGELCVVPLNPTNRITVDGHIIDRRTRIENGAALGLQPYIFKYFSLS